MTNMVSEADKSKFHEDGVVALRGVVDEHWLGVLADAVEADIANPGPYYHGYEPEDGQGRFHGNLRTWQAHEGFRAFCCDSPMPALAAEILDSKKINLLYDQLFVKEPGTTNPTRWHNDQPYWPMDGYQVITLWVALDKTTHDSGALEFIRGSHKWDRFFQPEPFGKNETRPYEQNPEYEAMIDVESARDEYDIITFDLEPGDVYAFHALTVHAAGGNHSRTRRRRGYAVRYTGDDVTYSTRLGVNAGLRAPELNHGDPLDSETYPVLAF